MALDSNLIKKHFGERVRELRVVNDEITTEVELNKMTINHFVKVDEFSFSFSLDYINEVVAKHYDKESDVYLTQEFDTITFPLDSSATEKEVADNCFDILEMTDSYMMKRLLRMDYIFEYFADTTQE